MFRLMHLSHDKLLVSAHQYQGSGAHDAACTVQAHTANRALHVKRMLAAEHSAIRLPPALGHAHALPAQH